ncbi:MAG: biotin--[acetyl-CoA-carboxylase] ligase [Armatimonadetes bacterium]|nr:biotin--[acetyl-CoA-carboxylase] ligase [Armatimonadota bacterium]
MPICLPNMIGEPILRLETTDSTNRVALDWDEAPHGAAVVARAQSGGRGRLGRHWESPPDAGLYLSLILRPESPQNSAVWSLLAALGVARALEKLSGLKIGLKWPNDVLGFDPDGAPRKIGGILGEAKGSKIVVGIGINLNQSLEELPERPIFPASSLRLLSACDWDVDVVLAAVLSELDDVLGRNWDEVRADFERRCWGIGEVARFESEGASLLGVVAGVDGDGALMLRSADGLKRVVAGELSYFL